MMDVDRALSPSERTQFTPRDVHVSVLSNGSVSVSWTPPTSDRPVASYRVWTDSVNVTVVPSRLTSKVIRLDGGRTHFIQVQAVDAEGNESDRTAPAAVAVPNTGRADLPQGNPTNREASIAFLLALASGMILVVPILNLVVPVLSSIAIGYGVRGLRTADRDGTSRRGSKIAIAIAVVTLLLWLTAVILLALYLFSGAWLDEIQM